jgi:hypothetical protein
MTGLPPLKLPDTGVAAELEDAIIAVSTAMKAFSKSRLKRETIVLLVQNAVRPKLAASTVNAVFTALEQLEATYLKPAPLTPPSLAKDFK